ncbi:MAG: hypothetical protein CSA62_15200 [Planctomycetota bacterium]|nr:MAG: hypothetical protein CSA62_15200 [Planctomycetota bacterium]
MSRSTNPVIIKSNGEREVFRTHKLRTSLRRAGANPSQVKEVVARVGEKLKDGMTTRQLYRIAFQTLRRIAAHDHPVAALYSLKRSIMELGPSGYPFEHLVAALFEAEGLPSICSVTMDGRYVSHEIDVVAGRGRQRQLCECKLRTHSEGKVDVKVAMYIYARAEDLRAIPRGYDKYWLVTNGRFTSDAIAFGEGMGLKLVGWNYPKDNGLEHRIERSGIHPITALSQLSKAEKARLLNKGIVLCRHFLKAKDRELARWIAKTKLAKARNEAEALIAAGSA